MPDAEDRLDRLEETVEQIVDLLIAIPGGPWTWHLLAPEKQKMLWDELYEFVSWLEERYLVNLSREAVPFVPCWYLHPIAVEMLTALMVAHRAVYARSKTVPSLALADWHANYLWPTLAKLKDLNVFKKCGTPDGHKPTERSPIDMDPVAFDKFVMSTMPVDADENTGELQS